jgi:hypothetical protein
MAFCYRKRKAQAWAAQFVSFRCFGFIWPIGPFNALIEVSISTGQEFDVAFSLGFSRRWFGFILAVRHFNTF